PTQNASTTEIIINATCDNITGCNGGTPSNPITVSADLSDFVWSNNDNTLTFQVTLTNTTQQGTYTTAQWQAINISSFGFNTSPTTTASGGDSQFSIFNDANFPGFNHVEVCAGSGNGSCEGGS